MEKAGGAGATASKSAEFVVSRGPRAGWGHFEQTWLLLCSDAQSAWKRVPETFAHAGGWLEAA